MRIIRLAVFALLGLLAPLAVGELLLRLLPVPAGLTGAAPRDDWPIHRMEPNTAYVSSSGWNLQNVQRGKINNFGYIAPFDYRVGADVGVVIGDSFIEGYMNPYDGMLQARLASHLGMAREEVYNFGTSGASAPHYLGAAGLIGKVFKPRWAAILIVGGDFAEGDEQISGLYRWSANADKAIELTPEQPKGLLARTFRELALVRYGRMNIKISFEGLAASIFKPDSPPKHCNAATLAESDKTLLDKYVEKLTEALHIPANRIVLIFDADREAIYKGLPQEPACPARDGLGRAYLRERAMAAGMQIVDAASLFAAAWARDRQPLDRSPVDGHWNAAAHGLVARAAADALIKSGAVVAKGR
jgi:hypothetical protein